MQWGAGDAAAVSRINTITLGWWRNSANGGDMEGLQ